MKQPDKNTVTSDFVVTEHYLLVVFGDLISSRYFLLLNSAQMQGVHLSKNYDWSPFKILLLVLRIRLIPILHIHL